MKKKNKKEKVQNKKIRKKSKKKIWIILLKGFIIFCLLCIIGVMIGAVIFWKNIVDNAPEFDESNLYRSESTIVYDSTGVIIGKLGSVYILIL